jgi:hypothetical protein
MNVPLRLNEWALAGTWDVARHAGIAIEPAARIAFRFQARDLNLVMGPTSRGASIPFRCFLDGVPASTHHGVDLGSDGSGVLTEQRTYQLIRQNGPIMDHLFEIEFLGRVGGVLLHVRLTRRDDNRGAAWPSISAPFVACRATGRDGIWSHLLSGADRRVVLLFA